MPAPGPLVEGVESLAVSAVVAASVTMSTLTDTSLKGFLHAEVHRHTPKSATSNIRAAPYAAVAVTASPALAILQCEEAQ